MDLFIICFLFYFILYFIILHFSDGGRRFQEEHCRNEFTVACSACNVRRHISVVYIRTHTAERPGKDNELFQQFLPESTHNAIHLPDSSEAEPPSSACCSAQCYALVNSLCIPLHPSTTLHRSSQSVFGH